MNKLIGFNEEIESVSLHTLRPVLLHGYVLPFVLLYGGWLYVWVAVLGFTEYVEAGCIGVVVIGLLQVVCSLLCHWFVTVRCFLTCNRVQPALLLLLYLILGNIYAHFLTTPYHRRHIRQDALQTMVVVIFSMVLADI